MILKANAKINLSLDITGILPDGYHALDTVMQSVSLFDEVKLETAKDGIIIECSEKNVPTDERNTAFKAAKLFFEKTGIQGGVKIFIKKNIPSQAGLGGGSADAAAVLFGLNKLYPDKISREELFDIALSVGADVPFCLEGGTCHCLEKGEKLTRLPDFCTCVLLAKPKTGVSTASAFKRFDTLSTLIHPDIQKVLEAYKSKDGRYAAEYSLNIFEQLVDIPETELIKSVFSKNGAYFSSLSGSGSCFFGLFDNKTDCLFAAEEMKKSIPFVAVCTAVKSGIEVIEE